MLVTPPHNRLFSLAALLTLGLSGCGVPIVTQCNNFTAVINEAEKAIDEDMSSFQEEFPDTGKLSDLKDFASKYIDAVGKITARLDTIGGDLQALELPDETLAGYRDRYVELLPKTSQAMTQTSDAMGLLLKAEKETDLLPIMGEFQEKAMGAFGDLDKLSAEGSTLTDEINGYCSENAK